MTTSLSLAVSLAVSMLGQQPELPKFVQEHVKEMTFYYQSPDPELGPKLLAEFLAKENLEHPWFPTPSSDSARHRMAVQPPALYNAVDIQMYPRAPVLGLCRTLPLKT